MRELALNILDIGVIDLPERTVDALVERLRRGGGDGI